MQYCVSTLCEYLACSRSGYYGWIKNGKPIHGRMNTCNALHIMAVYMEKPTRGRRQVQMLLERQYDLHMSLGSVHRYMQIMKLQSKRKRKYVPQRKETQNPLHTFPNVLQQDFCVSTQPKWLTDITCIPCKDGMLYLSCIKDLCDKSIVAYSMSNKNDLQLVFDTLHQAEPRMQAGIILHSDRGSQYCSPIYHQYVQSNGLTVSMSRPGTPYDNAPMESFFSLLKNEELRLYKHQTILQTRNLIDRFVDYYNFQRPQWTLKKMTPVEFGSHLH